MSLGHKDGRLRRVGGSVMLAIVMLLGSLAGMARVEAAPAAGPVRQEESFAALQGQLDDAWNAADWPAALDILTQMRAIDPANETVLDRLHRGHLNYGWELLSIGACPEAGEQFQQALGVSPGSPEAQRGVALVRERCPEAIEVVHLEVPPVVTPEAPPPPPPASADPAPNRVLPTPVPVTPQPVSQPTVYTVRAGDTLFSLARRYGVTVERLRQVNGIEGNLLRVGQQITIPPPGDAPPVDAPPSGPVHHLVQPGETLYSLARRYGTTVEAIREANGLPDNTIRALSVLVIPVADEAAPVVHTVRAGETLYRIARHYGTTVPLLMQANGLPGDHIWVGQRLVVPSPRWDGAPPDAGQPPLGRVHRVVHGDTLYSLARRYGTTVQAIQTANGLPDTQIRTGLLLIIP